MIYVINEIKTNYIALTKQRACDYFKVKSICKEAKLKESKTIERKQRLSKWNPLFKLFLT